MLDAALAQQHSSAVFHCLHGYAAVGNTAAGEAVVRQQLVAPVVAAAVADASASSGSEAPRGVAPVPGPKLLQKLLVRAGVGGQGKGGGVREWGEAQAAVEAAGEGWSWRTGGKGVVGGRGKGPQLLQKLLMRGGVGGQGEGGGGWKGGGAPAAAESAGEGRFGELWGGARSGWKVGRWAVGRRGGGAPNALGDLGEVLDGRRGTVCTV